MKCRGGGGNAVEVRKPQHRGGCGVTQQHFSRGPMSDYLAAPVIIQRDLNLPAML